MGHAGLPVRGRPPFLSRPSHHIQRLAEHVATESTSACFGCFQRWEITKEGFNITEALYLLTNNTCEGKIEKHADIGKYAEM